MNDPMLNSTMRRHPEWHVKVYNPQGRGATGTSARGYLLEYDDAIREAKADAWDEGRDAAIEAFDSDGYYEGTTNPYRGDSR